MIQLLWVLALVAVTFCWMALIVPGRAIQGLRGSAKALEDPSWRLVIGAAYITILAIVSWQIYASGWSSAFKILFAPIIVSSLISLLLPPRSAFHRWLKDHTAIAPYVYASTAIVLAAIGSQLLLGAPQ